MTGVCNVIVIRVNNSGMYNFVTAIIENPTSIIKFSFNMCVCVGNRKFIIYNCKLKHLSANKTFVAAFTVFAARTVIIVREAQI